MPNFIKKIITDEEAYPTSDSKQSELSLCFLGSMEWMPNLQGIEWFLDTCWPTLRKKFPSLSLHIAGKGMTEEMKNRTIPGVTFYGAVPSAASFICAHPIVVVPLLSGGGMRLKIVEAMAAGRCVISTPVGAEGIEATSGKELLLANNVDDYVAHITTLIAEPSKLEYIQKSAYTLAQEKYSWQKLVRTLEKFYLEVL
jgi:polysaccharide biosynthesis protein PslH